MKTMLNTYKQLLEQEKQAALNQHFEDFMQQLAISEPEKSGLRNSFFALIDILDSEGTLQERTQRMA